MDAAEHNRRAWDQLARQGSRFARPATREDFRDPSRVINPFGWLPGSLKGLGVLCLAAGGGRHGPLFASRGARVVVADLSREMLDLDREVARREGLELATLQASMESLDALGEAEFDVVLQPVSTCYIEDAGAVYREVARVLRPRGIYISQHKQPASLQAGAAPCAQGGYAVREPYFRKGPLPPQDPPSAHRESGALEHLHTLEQLLGGLCRAGFLIDDLREPLHADPRAPRGDFGERSRYLPPYLAVRAVRRPPPGHGSPGVVLPA